MKRSIAMAGVMMLGLAGMAAAAGLTPVRTLEPQQDPAEAILNSTCATCHDLTAVQPGLYTMAEWQDTIDRMVGYGAAVTDEQVQTILHYLGTDAPADAGGGGASTEEAAMAVLNSSCTFCHDLSNVQPGFYTTAEWQETIDRMVGYGAAISDDDRQVILHYLATDAGAEDEATAGAVDADAAIAVLNTSCATCHDLTAVQPGLYTGAEWTEVITRMRGYGAVISDEDANTVLSYLATDWQ